MNELKYLSQELPYLYATNQLQGHIRQSPEDFIVEEDLGFEPDGHGHHIALFIEKRDTNTAWIAKQLARYAAVHPREIGYAGLKDRHAVTRQWFTVHLAGKDIDWSDFNTPQWHILKTSRHQRKLRPGFLKGNHFHILIRELHGNTDVLNARLETIKHTGFPNYFGEQRFGFDNLSRALNWLNGELRIKQKTEKGLLLSSLRSAIFNQLLAARIRHSECAPLPGDVFMLAGSHSFFVPDTIDNTILQRHENHDIFVTGPLFGNGKNPSQQEALRFEDNEFAKIPMLCERLCQQSLTLQRRPLIAVPDSLRWHHAPEENTLSLQFFLPAGSYATAFIRELIAV